MMERKIKIEYNPQRTYSTESGSAHSVALMTDAELTALLSPLSKVYVSPTGNDGNDGLSTGQAVRTIAKAIEIAVTDAHDAIVFMAGVHGYHASHCLFGKKAIAMPGAQFTNFGFDMADGAFVNTFIGPSIGGNVITGTTMTGQPTWFTGRTDQPANVGKANRFYIPAMSAAGTLRLLRLRTYYDTTAGAPAVADPTEFEWQVTNVFTTISAYFASNGYPSVSYQYTSFPNAFRFASTTSMVANSDGDGKVFVITSIKMDLAGGTNYRSIILIWYDGAIQYWYENYITSPGPGETYEFLNVGSATTAGPAIAYSSSYGGGGYHRYSAIQPNKRMTDPNYKYEAVKTEAVTSDAKYMIAAFYYDGVPMFPRFESDGLCYSAQQLSDALQAAGGTYASLPTWAKNFFAQAHTEIALARGYRTSGIMRLYNQTINPSLWPLQVGYNVNPNSPYMTGPRMTQTDGSASSRDPSFFESAEAHCDNLFYGGAVINFKWYAEGDYRTFIGPSQPAEGGLHVHGLGVNSRLQNCECYLTDYGTQRIAAAGSAIWYTPNKITPADPKYLEAWIPSTIHDTDLNADGTPDSNCIKVGRGYRISINKGTPGDHRIKNVEAVGVYLLVEGLKLWHVSAAACAYATTDDSLIHACCFAYFTGVYLTPDGSPVTIEESVVREALSQNLIPPSSMITNCVSGDPYFKSSATPYDLRLQAISKGDFFDSPALALSTDASAFTGQREAGAYDDKGLLTITFDSFWIDFPWMMPVASDRVRITNRRRDGVISKLSVSQNTITLRLQWQVALSEADLRNLEKLQNAAEALVRIYFKPAAQPTQYLLGYVDQAFRHGGPMALLSDASNTIQLDIDVQQPQGSLYDYL